MASKFKFSESPLRRLLTPRRAVALAIVVPFSLLAYILNAGAFRESTLRYPWTAAQRYSVCTPAQYGNGSWTPRHNVNANTTVMTAPEDALRFSGFEGCASSREFFWHLAADREEQYNRFPAAQSWDWIPGAGCEGLSPLYPEALVRQLVEDGGWYLVGDSVTENHFFSLSCILYPHVIATPNYEAGGSFDRAWPQNIYLSPKSPLLPSISFPPGFDVASTPLVTFRRNDLLLAKEALVAIHGESEPLFSEEAVWTVPLAEYLIEFAAPHYATMVVSTGGHWTTTLFEHASPPGIDGVVALFAAAMNVWARGVQDVLTAQPRRKRVVVRAYLPGHEDCHSHTQPLSAVQPFQWNWYNWAEIWRFNEIFENLLTDKAKYPDVHFLAIDRPARLRPDAHTTGDCLHIMTGAGVLEGWSHYISHFIKSH